MFDSLIRTLGVPLQKTLEEQHYSTCKSNFTCFRAFGTVFIARDIETDEVVAVKMVCLQKDKKALGLLVKEIEALSLLQHDNIINYRASYRVGSSLWIIMEYLEG